MEEEEDMPPFWLQATDGRRLRRQASSIFLNSGVLLLILLVIAFVFVFIVVPSVVSFTSQIFKPNLIKKSWDYLNLVLVLFAVVCGFLGRNHNNSSNNESPSYQSIASSNAVQNDAQRSYPSTPVNRWYQDRTAYSTLNRLRSFNSYPDLRQESLWMSNEERWRFYDDTHLIGYRLSNSDQVKDVLPPPPGKHEEMKKVEQDVSAKDIDVDTPTKEKEVVYTPPAIALPPESPTPPPRSPPKLPKKAVRRKVKRTYEDIGYEKNKVERDFEVQNSNAPPPSPPQPPPVLNKNEKKRAKDLLTPFRKKKKKQRQKSVENLESLFDPQSSFYQSSIPPPSPAPPPPPPPPPPHFFQNLFSSKKSRAKKLAHSAPPAPPPPPPRPVTAARISEARASRTTVQVAAAVTAHKPPKSVKTGGFSGAEENMMESGNLSPLNPIPPPPPLPPFKMTSWKFVQDGDYVRVASFNSSRSGSPDLESEDPSDKESSPMAVPKDGNGDSIVMPLFCPSPDVNTKAENFIARFRAGLKMEKMNSVKGRSNLGPGPDTVEGEGPT